MYLLPSKSYVSVGLGAAVLVDPGAVHPSDADDLDLLPAELAAELIEPQTENNSLQKNSSRLSFQVPQLMEIWRTSEVRVARFRRGFVDLELLAVCALHAGEEDGVGPLFHVVVAHLAPRL